MSSACIAARLILTNVRFWRRIRFAMIAPPAHATIHTDGERLMGLPRSRQDYTQWQS
ncbi:hypothetical protein FBZ93_101582 [Bradyrhizobium macuxiense]|uniref:Uncharacterized protein n=1 Tax=Bradyrhizobium macuxiense TaxID=1755647 RepID=A0A560MIU7_9BRAD|nr:hypothetical protein FBZ93_101582 [Bradyrhizobium macuxiense]